MYMRRLFWSTLILIVVLLVVVWSTAYLYNIWNCGVTFPILGNDATTPCPTSWRTFPLLLSSFLLCALPIGAFIAFVNEDE